jgi:hypothetical protein
VSILLPTPLPVVSGWNVADWLDRSFVSDPAGADGVALLTLPAVPDGERWQLTHAVVSCTSTTDTQLRIYLDAVGARNLRDGSQNGGFDVADWSPGLWVPPGRTLLARWTGATTGAYGTLTLQATIWRQS